MDPGWIKALGTLLAISLSKTGCSIWKEKAEDRVGLEASSVYSIRYPFNCFGSTCSEAPGQPGQAKQGSWYMASFSLMQQSSSLMAGVVTSGIKPALGPHEYLEWGPTENWTCQTEP